MSIYVVDTNFFIQAHRYSYPLDVALSFWSKVKQIAGMGKIISIDKVKNEIYNNDDALTYWCKNNLPEGFFKDTKSVLDAYRQIVNWVDKKRDHYNPNAINEFLSADEADSWLVAFALTDVTNRVIVTYERSEPNSKSKIKIPDVCNPVGVQYVNTIDMFRQLGETF